MDHIASNDDDFDPGAEWGFSLEQVGTAIILKPLSESDVNDLARLRRRRDFPRHVAATVPADGAAKGVLVVDQANVDELYAWLCDVADRNDALMEMTDGLITAISGWR